MFEKSPKAVITHAEILSQRMRKKIENALSTEVFDQYGSTEFDRMAWECKEHSFHMDADSMLIEFLKGNDDVSSCEEGNLIITGFANYLFPLIRYSIEDKGVPLDDVCSCGRGLPLIKGINGRQEDYVVAKDGEFFSPKIIIDKMDLVQFIKRYQIVQINRKKIELHTAPDCEMSDKNVELIKNQVKKLFKNKFDVKIVEVDGLKKSWHGKIKLVQGIL